MAGEKTWELRPDAHVQPGRVYISVATRRRDKGRAGDGAEVLVPKGVRYIIGSVEVVRPRRITEAEFDANAGRHRFDERRNDDETAYAAAVRMAGGKAGVLYAWELRDAKWYEWPVPYKASPSVRWPAMEPPGAVGWSGVQRAACGEGAYSLGRRVRRQPVDGGVAEAEERVSAAEARPRRAVPRVDYDAGARRGARASRGPRQARSTAYMDMAGTEGRGGGVVKPSQVAVSPHTVERMTGGRYDWQDGELLRRRRRLLVDDGRARDPG